MVTQKQVDHLKNKILSNFYGDTFPFIELSNRQTKIYTDKNRVCFLKSLGINPDDEDYKTITTYYKELNIGVILPEKIESLSDTYWTTDLEQSLTSCLREYYESDRKLNRNTDLCDLSGGHDGYTNEWLIELYLEDNTIIGWSSWTKHNKDETVWCLNVIWVHESIRGGFLKANWKRWKEVFGDFAIESPLSKPMARAVEKLGGCNVI